MENGNCDCSKCQHWESCEIKMVIHNPLTIGDDADFGCKAFGVKRGDKIGQLILKRHEGWLLPSEYTKDEERMGGFGSTNKKEE